ncbi:MAG: YheT family hydrolase [Lutibacter sp.]
MPLIKSTYQTPFLFKINHFNTIYKTLLYNKRIKYKRYRIATPDDDFLDIDFSLVKSDRIIILLHGLEGSSYSKYIIAMTKFLNEHSVSVAAVNFRGCSGVPNNKPYAYHSGKTDDLNLIIKYISEQFSFQSIGIIGYSMGGNILLKYLGESWPLNSCVKVAVAVSVPCDLESSSKVLGLPKNRVYLKRFLKSLKRKALETCDRYPHLNLNRKNIKNSRDFIVFDNEFTAPLFNFKNAKDYYTKNNSLQFIKNIKTNTLIINALDDSFLSNKCYPYKECKSHQFVQLETPNYGGHVGFNISFISNKNNWIEQRILNFCNQFFDY